MPDKLITLLKTNGPGLHALLTRLAPGPEAADELMQELFLRLFRSAAFGKAENPVAYAFRAAIHLAFDARKKRRRTVAGELPETMAAEQTLPLHAMMRAEQIEQVLAAIAELSPEAGEAAVLHFIEQQSYEETARVMGKSPQQVRGLCHDALRQLREKFQAQAKEMTHE